MENEGAKRMHLPEGLDITLRDIMLFTSWMEEAHHALTEGGFFPDEPNLRSACVRSWVRLFASLHRRWLAAGSHRMMLESQLQFQENYLARLATTLYENIGCLHDSLGLEERARVARGRAACCVQAFRLRSEGVG